MGIQNGTYRVPPARVAGYYNANLSTNRERMETDQAVHRKFDAPVRQGVSELLRSEYRDAHSTMREMGDGVSILQSAEGAIEEIQLIIHRLRRLAVEATSDELATVERAQIEIQKNQLITEIDRLAMSTSFGGIGLLSESSNANIEIQVGSGDSDAERISLYLDSALAIDLGIDDASLDLSSAQRASEGVGHIDDALAALDEDLESIYLAGAQLGEASFKLALNARGEMEAVPRYDGRAAEIEAESWRAGVASNAVGALFIQANISPWAATRLVA